MVTYRRRAPLSPSRQVTGSDFGAAARADHGPGLGTPTHFEDPDYHRVGPQTNRPSTNFSNPWMNRYLPRPERLREASVQPRQLVRLGLEGKHEVSADAQAIEALGNLDVTPPHTGKYFQRDSSKGLVPPELATPGRPCSRPRMPGIRTACAVSRNRPGSATNAARSLSPPPRTALCEDRSGRPSIPPLAYI